MRILLILLLLAGCYQSDHEHPAEDEVEIICGDLEEQCCDGECTPKSNLICVYGFCLSEYDWYCDGEDCFERPDYQNK